MNRKKSILISLTGITVVMLALLGLTYGYYITNIIGNTNSNSISIDTKDLKLVYNDGTEDLVFGAIEPGWTNSDEPKVFTVNNTGKSNIDEYAVGIDEVINTLNRTEDLVYTITCKSYLSSAYEADGDEAEENGVCRGDSGEFPKENSLILTNQIDSGYIHVYEMVISYKYLDDVNQSEDMGASVGGRIQIYTLPDTIDITGTVASYNEGDYVQINSNPKTSQLIKNSEGKYEYKFIGVPIGSHTISIRNISDVDTPKGEKTLTIKLGNTAGYDDTNGILTITNASRTAIVNLGTISNNTFGLTMSTPLDRDITPPEVTVVYNTETPRVNRNFTATITHSDAGSGVDITKSKWIINQVSTNINGLEGYTWTKFTTNPETITLTQTTSGTYYLHLVSIDKEGNQKEIIKTIEVGEPVISNFTIKYKMCDNYIRTYNFEEGMTWREFVNSDYNPSNVFGKIFLNLDGSRVTTDGMISAFEDADELIVAGSSYVATELASDCP